MNAWLPTGLVVSIALLWPSPGPAAPTEPGRLRIAAAQLSVFDNRATVPIECVGRGSCVGRIELGRKGKRVVLEPGAGKVTRFRVPEGARRVTIRFRYADGRRRSAQWTLRRTADPEFCGLGDFAEVVQRVGENALIFVPYRRPEKRAAYLCEAGVPRFLVPDGPDYVPLKLGLTALSRGWGVVEVIDYGDDRQPVVDHSLCAYRIGGTRPLSLIIKSRTVISVGVSDQGGIAVGLQTEQEDPQVQVVDAQGSRTVDQGPGVDPASVSVRDGAAFWSRDGAQQTAPIDGRSATLSRDDEACSSLL